MKTVQWHTMLLEEGVDNKTIITKYYFQKQRAETAEEKL